MDVACFIGFAPLAQSPLFSEPLKRWLIDYGCDQAEVEQLIVQPEKIMNKPIPLESWEAFRAVFDDRRLDRSARLRSLTLDDPLRIKETDRILHIVVDGVEVPVALKAEVGDADGQIPLESLAAQIRNGLCHTGATAILDPDTKSNLIIQRTDEARRGELTVYRNASLGFPTSVQADSSYLQHYSGAAIKAFFRQGGRKCYFICMGRPLPFYAGDLEKAGQLYTLIWGKEKAAVFFGADRSFLRSGFLTMFFPDIPAGNSPARDWNGLSHLERLADVTYVCFPDLVDLIGRVKEVEVKEQARANKENFVVCAEGQQETPYLYTTLARAPLYDEEAYRVWKRVILHILAFLSRHARTVQLVASLPLPEEKIRREFESFVTKGLLSEAEDDETLLRHLQLAFPWLKTEQSAMLPESLEPPEGALMGLLAAQSRKIGAFRSIAGSLAAGAYDLSLQDLDAYSPIEENGLCFSDRVSWFDFSPSGIELQSDVSAVSRGNYRYAVVRRIMILVQRAACRIGLSHVFEPNSERIWRLVRDNLTDLLHHMYLQNGLGGKSSQEAYSVTCGRSTMTQGDIDNGRLIANIIFQPAVPIERIAVDVLLERDGVVLFRGADQ
jgi:uncharacterized protein